MVTRKSFHEQLSEMQQDVLKMGTMVEQAIFDAVKSLKKRDESLAQQVIDGDDAIDDFQVRIEDSCIRLLALQQPMAGDLRVISAAMKIVNDLERMADHASDISKVTIRLSGQPLIKPLIDIPRMAEITQKMLRISLDAFVTPGCLRGGAVDRLRPRGRRSLSADLPGTAGLHDRGPPDDQAVHPSPVRGPAPGAHGATTAPTSARLSTTWSRASARISTYRTQESGAE